MSDFKDPKPKLDTTTIALDILRVAQGQGVHPRELSATVYWKKGLYKRAEVLTLGGFDAIVKAQFSAEIEPDLALAFENRKKRTETNSLYRKAGQKEYVIDQISHRLEKLFSKEKRPTKNRRRKKSASSASTDSQVVALWSDSHYGLTIDPEEIPNNAYNWEIASRRSAKFVQEIIHFNAERGGNAKELRLCLAGDLFTGAIHLDDAGLDLVSTQIHGTSQILIAALDHLSQEFESIKVVSIAGNHGRFPHKGSGKSYKQKFDGFDALLAVVIKEAFRHEDNISVHIPKTSFGTFKFGNHLFLLTHADTLVNAGSPSRSIDISRIGEQINRLNTSKIVDQNIDVVLLGHTHTPVFSVLENGASLIINGAMSGTDAYAQSVGFFASNPAQILFESTKEIPVRDLRVAYLGQADEDESLDEIIKPYDPALLHKI